MDSSYELDSVIIELTNSASLELKDYTTDNFNEIDAESVVDLTEYSTERVKEQRNNNISPDDRDVQSVNESTFNQILKITLNSNDKESLFETIEELLKRDDVLYAQPNYIFKCTSTPNDTCKNEQYAIEKIDLSDAWNFTTGKHSLKVGVIDSGINKNNPDLINRYDNALSKSFNEYPTYLSGNDEHGTHVAGIIGAEGNNSKGISGVCWDVSLVSLRTADNQGYSYHDKVISAIEYAKKNNIKLLNFSSSGTVRDQIFKDAIKNYNGLFICSAGNDYQDLDSSFNSYPTEYHLGNVISVASSDYFDFLLGDSNYGANTVDLAAPGDNILSTYQDTYVYKSGTSMAAPQVTGVAALIWSKYPNLSAAEVKSAILNNVDEVDNLDDQVKTDGRLNAFKAISSIENKQFIVKFDSNGGTGTMEDQTITYGKTTRLLVNDFVRTGYDFSGWFAYRKSDNKWLYTNGVSNAWYIENEQPDGYYKFLYNNQARIAKTSSINNDVITMYAQWVEKELLYGDVDLDGVISINDATILQKYLVGSITLNDEQLLVADVDKNGYINVSDVTEIQKILVN